MKEIEKDVPVTATLFRTEEGRFVIEIHVDGLNLLTEDLTCKSGGWLEWARTQFDPEAIAFLCENCAMREMHVPNLVEVLCSMCGGKTVRLDNEGQPIEEPEPIPRCVDCDEGRDH